MALNGNPYYIYAHKRGDNDSIFYVGKGKDGRAWKKSGRTSNTYWNNIVNKHGYTVKILLSGLSEKEALRKEKRFIKLLDNQLCNLTKGGEGSSGYRHTKESKKKMSNWQKGRRLSEEHKNNIGKAQRGRKGSELQRETVINYNKTRKVTAEMKAKIGKKNSREYIIYNETEEWSFESQTECSSFLGCNKCTVYEYSKINKEFRGYNILKIN